MYDYSKKRDWTEKLYVENPQLYLPVLQDKVKESEPEVEGLCRIFSDFKLGHSTRILDLCCGIGRHAIPLARKGYHVVGFDISKLYLKLAILRAKRERIPHSRLRFYRGDIRSINEDLKKKNEREFDVIICMFQSLGYYSSINDCEVIRQLAKISKNEAILILELENRDWWFVNFRPFNQYQFKNTVLNENWYLDALNSTARAATKFYKRINRNTLHLELELECVMRLYSIHEIIEIARKCGWTYRITFGDLSNLAPFDLASKQMIIVFSKS
jgi:SAM-dependent methyltransferase